MGWVVVCVCVVFGWFGFVLFDLHLIYKTELWLVAVGEKRCSVALVSMFC